MTGYNKISDRIFDITSRVYSRLWQTNCKEPTFLEVFKKVKEDFSKIGVNFASLNNEEKEQIKKKVESAYKNYKEEVYFVDDKKLGMILASLPNITSEVYYQLKQSNNKVPRFDSVFKIIKEKYLPGIRVKFSMLDDSQKYEIEEMVRDVYFGIREGE